MRPTRRPAALTTRLVREIADARGADPLDVPPIYREIDPEAIDRLYRSASCEWRLELTVAESTVSIASHGTIDVEVP